MFVWIIIISIVFIAVLPFMCSDVFYYLGIGRLAGTYGQNPYYVTINDFVEEGNNKQLLETDTVLGPVSYTHLDVYKRQDHICKYLFNIHYII